MKTGIYSWFGYAMPFEERIKLIKAAGFDSVMLWWSDDNIELNGPKTAQPAIVQRYGLAIENAHLPFAGIKILWTDTPEADEREAAIIAAIKECAAYGIKTVVMHTTNGNKPPVYSETIIKRLQRIGAAAARSGVRLAIENLKMYEALDYLMTKLDDPNIGFCFDSGHHNCYCADQDLLKKYGDRLFAVHLHDNFGDADMHMLPYDGNIDWHKIASGIAASAYAGAWTLELEGSKYEPYHQLSATAYLNRAYVRLNRVINEKEPL